MLIVIRNRLFLIASFFMLFGCGTTEVDYTDDSVNGLDYSKLKTYAWSEKNEHNIETRKYLDNEIFYKRISSSIENELESKGFTKSATPDFYVNYTITVRDQVDVNTYNTYEGVVGDWNLYNSYGFDGVYGYFPHTTLVFTPERVLSHEEVELTHHDEGSLIVDIISAETGKLVWRGFAHGHLKKKHLSSDKLDKLIAEVVNNTLKNFPPEKR